MTLISRTEAAGYAMAVGFAGTALDIILAIASAESGLDTTARNVNSDSHTFPDGHTGPSTDRGILQINDYWWPRIPTAEADDPAKAFGWGWVISSRGRDFTPWATYGSGAYRRNMPVSATPPLRSQRPGFPGYLPPDDGNVDENPDNNCNWADYSCAIEALTGVRVPPDHLKDHDHFYGQGQVGPSYDGNNVFEDATYGVVQTLKSLAGAARESDIKAALASGQYVQVLIPSDWNNPVPSSASSHYVLLYADDGAGFWAMNPWDGSYMYRSYGRWALLDSRGADYLIYSKGASVIDITPLYTVHADGSATFKANGAVIGSGFYATVKALGIAAPPMFPHEIARPGAPGQTYMPFGDGNGEALTLYFDGVNVQVNEWLGHGMVSLEQARAAAVAQLADMRAQRDALSAKLTTLQAAYETATQASAAKDGQIAQLQAQVTQLQAQLAAGDPQSQDAKAALEGLRNYFTKYPAR